MQEVKEHNTKNLKVKESVRDRIFKYGNAGMAGGDVVEMMLDHYENCPCRKEGEKA